MGEWLEICNLVAIGGVPNNYFMPNGYINGGYANNANFQTNNAYMPRNGLAMAQDINSLYPSIYRIVYPVVQKVTDENNFRVINDEAVSNATNTVYNIVEGDLTSAQDSIQSSNFNANSQMTSNTQVSSASSQNNSTSATFNQGNSAPNYNANGTQNSRNNAASSTVNGTQANNNNLQSAASNENLHSSKIIATASSNQNLLLKDLIRILVIRELIAKSNSRRQQYNQPYYQFMPNYVF